MAYYDGVFSDPTRGSRYRLRLHMNLVSQDRATLRSVVQAYMEIVEVSEWGTYSLSNNGNRSWNINGNAVSEGAYSYDFRGGSNVKALMGPANYVVQHNSAGVSSGCPGSGYTNSASTLGSASTGGTLALPNITPLPPPATVPLQPGPPHLAELAPGSLRATWSAPGNGGSAITGYRVQEDDNSAFSSPTTHVHDTTLTRDLTGLSPGDHWVRVAAVNSVGVGPYSVASTLDLGIGGKRFDGTNFVPFSVSKRFDGTNWVDIALAKRFDGTNWVDIA